MESNYRNKIRTHNEVLSSGQELARPEVSDARILITLILGGVKHDLQASDERSAQDAAKWLKDPNFKLSLQALNSFGVSCRGVAEIEEELVGLAQKRFGDDFGDGFSYITEHSSLEFRGEMPEIFDPLIPCKKYRPEPEPSQLSLDEIADCLERLSLQEQEQNRQ
jgi:hypothetical protein